MFAVNTLFLKSWGSSFVQIRLLSARENGCVMQKDYILQWRMEQSRGFFFLLFCVILTLSRIIPRKIFFVKESLSPGWKNFSTNCCRGLPRWSFVPLVIWLPAVPAAGGCPSARKSLSCWRRGSRGDTRRRLEPAGPGSRRSRGRPGGLAGGYECRPSNGGRWGGWGSSRCRCGTGCWGSRRNTHLQKTSGENFNTRMLFDKAEKRLAEGERQWRLEEGDRNILASVLKISRVDCLTLVDGLFWRSAPGRPLHCDEGVALHGLAVKEGGVAALREVGASKVGGACAGAVVVARAMQRIGHHGTRVLTAEFRRISCYRDQNC